MGIERHQINPSHIKILVGADLQSVPQSDLHCLPSIYKKKNHSSNLGGHCFRIIIARIINPRSRVHGCGAVRHDDHIHFQLR